MVLGCIGSNPWAGRCEAPQERAAEGRKAHKRQLYYKQQTDSSTNMAKSNEGFAICRALYFICVSLLTPGSCDAGIESINGPNTSSHSSPGPPILWMAYKALFVLLVLFYFGVACHILDPPSLK